jgi:hypothetical protein
MRKSTSRTLRFSATAMGVAALGLTFAGTASAEEPGGGVLGGDNNNSDYGDSGYGDHTESNGITDLGGVSDIGGIDSLDTFGLPTASHAYRSDVELPEVSALGLTRHLGGEGLPTSGSSGQGLNDMSLDDVKINPFNN